MNYNWNWAILFEPSPEGRGTYLDMLLLGLGWTVATGICAWIVALVFGSMVGVARTLPSKTAARRGFAYVSSSSVTSRSWCSCSSGISSCQVVPDRLGALAQAAAKRAFLHGGRLIGIGLCMSARVAEQVRAGVSFLARGQGRAALAVGLTLPQSYRYVLLPMAYRIILPPLTSEFLQTIKNTSVALTIGLLELTSRAPNAGVFVPGVRSVYGCDRDLPAAESRRGRRLRAGSSTASPCPAISPARGRTAAMFKTFDFDVIWRSLPYLFLDGMVFTLQSHRCWAAACGIVLGTLIAMLRLSRFALLSKVAVATSTPAAFAATRARHLLVLFPHPLGLAVGDRGPSARRRSAPSSRR